MLVQVLGHCKHEAVMREYSLAGKVAVPLGGVGSMGDPVGGGEVDSLADVGAHAETSVEGPGESYNELTGVLEDLADGDISLAEEDGGEHRSDMVEEIGGVLHSADQEVLENLGGGGGRAKRAVRRGQERSKRQ